MPREIYKDKSMLAIQKKLTNSFLALLSLPSTAVGFALSTQIAALSWILKTKYNLDVHEVTFVWLAGPLAGIFGQIIVGLISDNVWFMEGRRRPFIVIGGIIGALMFLALPQIGVISEKTGITSIILIASVIALLLDLSINVTFNPARSIIADLTPPGKARTKGFVLMQVVSGTFGVLAYFISMLFGNEKLLSIAAGIVFVCAVFPVFFIEEPKKLTKETDENTNNAPSKTSILDFIKILFPLAGFLIFGIFSMIYHFYQEQLDFIHNYVLIACLLYTIIIGVYTIIEGFVKPSNSNEFKKIMLAHGFTWVGFQSMFIISGFFVDKQLVPNMDLGKVIANFFAQSLSGEVQNKDATVGNIVSLGFLLLNAVGAIFPAVLQILCKYIGRVKTYVFSLSFSALGFYYLAYFVSTELDFYIGMFLIGIGWSAVISIVFSIVSERIDQAKMGLYMGIFNLAVVLPQMMSNGIGNILVKVENYSLLYLLCGVFVTTSVIFWIFVREPKNLTESQVKND